MTGDLSVQDGSTATATIGHVEGHGDVQVRTILRGGRVEVEYRVGEHPWRHDIVEAWSDCAPSDTRREREHG